jgi:hypothetical protein
VIIIVIHLADRLGRQEKAAGRSIDRPLHPSIGLGIDSIDRVVRVRACVQPEVRRLRKGKGKGNCCLLMTGRMMMLAFSPLN